MGFRADQIIATADGPLRVVDVIELLEKNPEHQILALSWTGKRLFVSELTKVLPIGQQQVFDVVLDDGETVSVSASSRFITKVGARKMAPELTPGESLLPLYLKHDSLGYPTFQIPGRVKARKLSRLMAEWKVGHKLRRGTFVEHIDGNRLNYHPDNLKVTVNEDRIRRSYTNVVVKMFREVDALFDECAAASEKMAKIVNKGRKRRKKKKPPTNHKVVSVTPGRLTEVFTVRLVDCIALSVSGVFLEPPQC